MQWQEWSDVIPAEELQLLDKGRQQEIEQPLIDLGFLSGTSALRANATSFQSDFHSAIQQFRAAYFAAGLTDHVKFSILKQSNHELDSEELHLLHQLSGLDGNFEILELPKIGEQNLWTRILHYRLVVLGIFSESVEVAFSQKSLDAIKLLGRWLGKNNLLGTVNLAGDIPRLTATLFNSNILRKHVVIFNYQNPKTKTEILKEVTEEDGELEDEIALSNLENEIESEISEINKSLLSDEEARWEAIENKTKRKQKRVKRIEGKMKSILKKEQKVLTEGLQKELDIKKTIDQLKVQKTALSKDFKQSERAFDKQKEIVKAQNKNANKEIKQLTKEKKSLLNQISKPKDKTAALVLISQAAQNNRIRKQSLQHLKQNNGKKSVIKILKTDIKKTDSEISRLQLNIQSLKKIEAIEEKLITLKSDSSKFNLAKQKLDLIKKEKEKTEKLIKTVQGKVEAKNRAFSKAKQEREQRIGAQQIKLQQLNKRLKRLLEKVNGLSFRFKAQLSRSMNDSDYKKIRQKIFQERQSDFLEKAAKAPFNLFLIRLIQVRQWMNGYYYGRLDNQPGDRTFQSIVEFTEEENLPKLRLKYILTRLKTRNQKGFWLLNVQYYFECLVDIDKEGGPENTQELISLYEAEIDKDNSTFNNKNTKEAWTAYNRELEQGLDGSAHRIRRFYYGVKTLARNIGRVIHRVLRFIVKGVKIVLRILKNLIKIIYREIREGTQNFFDGMRFLFSQRSIETVAPNGALIITDYDFDFDARVFMSNNLPQETLSLHIKDCMARTSNLHFSLTLCGKVLKWVFTIATGSLTWPRLAIKIAFHFKSLVVRFFKERKKRLATKKQK